MLKRKQPAAGIEGVAGSFPVPIPSVKADAWSMELQRFAVSMVPTLALLRTTWLMTMWTTTRQPLTQLVAMLQMSIQTAPPMRRRMCVCVWGGGGSQLASSSICILLSLNLHRQEKAQHVAMQCSHRCVISALVRAAQHPAATPCSCCPAQIHHEP
jgi:hypothetical protein